MKDSRLLALARRGTWQLKAFAVTAILVGIGSSAVAAGNGSAPAGPQRKLDRELTVRADHAPATDLTPVIVTLVPGAHLPNEFKRYAKDEDALGLINGHVLRLPNAALKQLAAHPDVFDLHYDRPLQLSNYRTSLTTGSREVNRGLGFTGAG